MRYLILPIFASSALANSSHIAPIEAHGYGICAHLSRWEFDRANDELKLMKEAGIASVRLDLDWESLEAEHGEWNFSRIDSLQAKASGNGVTILPILGYHNSWANPAWKHMPEFLNYVGTLAERYGNEMPCWEVWNEPNSNHYWGANGVTEYANFITDVSREIKSVNPQLKVVYGGTMGPRIPFDFIEKTFQEGAAEAMDVMAIHPYSWQVPPEAFQASDIIRLRELMAHYNAGKKPIWITEVGYPTHPDGPSYWDILLPKLLVEMGVEADAARFILLNDDQYHYRTGLDLAGLAADEMPAKRIRNINFDELAKLKPAPDTVLVVARNEVFPSKYYGDLLTYLKQGGKLIFPSGLPLYYDARLNGDWVDFVQANDRYCGPIHVKWQASWTQKDIPIRPSSQSSFSFLWSKDGKEAALPLQPSLVSLRFFTGENLKDGDRFVPVLVGRAEKYSGALAGVYHLNSDLKGTIAVSGIVQETVSEKRQAEYLPRTMLIAFNAGVEKIFWYSLRSTEQSNGGEGHFGVLKRDLEPKAAWRAYKKLVSMYPPGSTDLQIITKDTADSDVIYMAKWRKPDGTDVCALWTVERERRVVLSGNFNRAFDYLGSEVSFRGTEAGSASFSIGPGLVYIVGGAVLTVTTTE
jgi:hypothetical protein